MPVDARIGTFRAKNRWNKSYSFLSVGPLSMGQKNDARKSKVAIFDGFGPENGEDIQKISILNRENNPTS